MASERALMMAAQAWCTPETETRTMDEALAVAFADIIDRYIEALIWTSGSHDFAIGEPARAGFERLVLPLIP